MDEILISVVVPCFNEKSSIERCLNSILNQKIAPQSVEIFVVDGISTDGTREIIKYFTESYPNVKLIDNILHKTPTAMNLGIKAARGKYVAILGAHSEYDENYLANSLKLFDLHPEIVCTGGPLESKGRTAFGHAVAMAMSSRIGVGNANHRFRNYEGYAEGACFPIFKREVFDVIGLYDESLLRNQDDELNFRLRKNGYKVYLSPEVRCEYYVRDNPGSLFKQYFEYGYWRVAVIKKHKIPTSFRQVVPITLLLSFMLGVLFSIFVPYVPSIVSLGMPALYLLLVFLMSLPVLLKTNLRIGISFLLAVVILHHAYALGFMKGMIINKEISNGK